MNATWDNSNPSCDGSRNRMNSGMTRNTKSIDDLAAPSKRNSLSLSKKNNRSCDGLTSESTSSASSSSNATWSTEEDVSPRRSGLRRMGSKNRLLGMVTGGGQPSDSPGSKSKSGGGAKSPQSTGRRVRRTLSGTMNRSLAGLKQMSKRTLICVRDDEDDKQVADQSMRRIQSLFQDHDDEPTMGRDEVADIVQTLIEANAEEAVRCSRAAKLQLDLATARQSTGNTIGSLIAMKKMKRIQIEQNKYLKVIGYLRQVESNLELLKGGGQKEQDSAEWLFMFKSVTKEVEKMLSVFEPEERWSNEALLEELISSTQNDKDCDNMLSSKNNRSSATNNNNTPMMMNGDLVTDDPAEESVDR